VQHRAIANSIGLGTDWRVEQPQNFIAVQDIWELLQQAWPLQKLGRILLLAALLDEKSEEAANGA
jgi:hypothetical protein